MLFLIYNSIGVQKWHLNRKQSRNLIKKTSSIHRQRKMNNE